MCNFRTRLDEMKKSVLGLLLLFVMVISGQAQQVDAGNGHAIILDENGDVWTVGRNNFGQLGSGTFINSPIPVKVEGLPKIKTVSRGYDHSLAIDVYGKVWIWGRNNYGQIGSWNLENHNKPKKFNHSKKMAAIEGGHWHSVAIAEDGTVWAWGHNFFAELGTGDREHSEFPKQVLCELDGTKRHLHGIEQIASVGYHTLALDSNGRVYTWGSNDYRELGNSSNRNETVARLVELPKIKSVAAGWHHSIALDEDGRVWFWGRDQAKRLLSREEQIISKPILLEMPSIQKIASGSWHSLALDESGQVWGWGSNRYGFLGTGDTISHSLPIKMKGLNNIREIGGGCFQSMAVDIDGNILTCGDNPSGQQGINNYKRVFEAKAMVLNTSGVLSINQPEKGIDSESYSIGRNIMSPDTETSENSGNKTIWWLLSISVLLNLLLIYRFFRK